MAARFYRAYSWWLLAVTLLTLPLVLRGAGQAVRGMKNDVRKWLPASFRETGELAWFRAQFLDDQFVIISWPECRGGSDDHRFHRFHALLDAETRRGPQSLFHRVTSGPHVLSQLTSEGAGLAYDVDEARERLQGTLFGPDGQQTCLIVTLTDAGLHDLHRVVGRGLLGRARGRIQEIADQCGIAEEDLHLGGPPVDNVAIDEEGSITLVRLVGLCVIAGLGLAYLCLRNVLLMGMVFLVGGFSAVLAMATVHWTGGYVDAVLMTMPALVYVLALSGAIHVVNYYRDALASGWDSELAPGLAAAHGWLPCMLCSVTTSLGMFSLGTSDIQPIRNFGFYSGVGVLMGLAVLFMFLPAALQVCRPRIHPQDLKSGLGFVSLPESLWSAYAHAIVRFRRSLLTIFGLGFVALAIGGTHIETSVDILKLFDSRAKIIQDYVWFEQHLGKLVPLELVIQIPPAQLRPPVSELSKLDSAARYDAARQLSFLQRMELTNSVQKAIERQFGQQGEDIVGRTLSATAFAPELPDAGGTLSSTAYRSALRSELERSRDELLATDYLRVDTENASELWRISLRVAALENVDYGRFVEQLRLVIQPVLDAYNHRFAVSSRLHELRGEQGLGGAVIGLIQVVPSLPRPPDDRDGTSHEGDLPREGRREGADAGLETWSELLGDALRADRLRVIEAEVSSPDEAEKLALEWFGDCDLVVIRGDVSNFPGRDGGPSSQVLVVAPPEANSHVHRGDEVTAVYTGIIPLIFKAQRTLLENLVESTGWSILLVSICMMFVLTPGHTWVERIRGRSILRGITAGIISMIPNVFPLFLVFGLLGWCQVPVDIGTMMTAGVALGIAVDDTIHYLTWFRRELNEHDDTRQAMRVAFQRCGNAMVQTTILGGLGMFVFAASTFSPTQRFGIMMLSLLAAALLGDMMLGPALYAGWCGRFFRRLPTGKEIHQQDGKEDSRTEPVDG